MFTLVLDSNLTGKRLWIEEEKTAEIIQIPKRIPCPVVA
jgi:hypothetical protein